MPDTRSVARWRALTAACSLPIMLLAFILSSAPTLAALPPPPVTPDPLALDPRLGAFVACFYRGNTPVCVSRAVARAAQSGDTPHVLLQSLLDGLTPDERAEGLRSALPAGAQLAGADVTGDVITVSLILPESFLYGGLDPLVSDEISTQIVKTLDSINTLRVFHVLARDPRNPAGAFKLLSSFLSKPPVQRKDGTTGAALGVQQENPGATLASNAGALSGKAVYLSAGHGWYWNGNSYIMDWHTQRYAEGSHDIIEDVNNAEVVNQYLLQYLRNAGADVWPVREHDMNTEEIILVHDQPGYTASGTWDITDPAGAGASYLGQPYRSTSTVTATATATATWAFTPTTTAQFALYAWYRVYDYSGGAHAPDVAYRIHHAGGATDVHINQSMHGNTWRYIGTFPFKAGQPASVQLNNLSTVEGALVTADAIRVGGGIGSVYGGGPPASFGTSGKPRWEEAARYWVAYQGAPPSMYSFSCTAYGVGASDMCQDITVRPIYAEWERESEQPSVFVSWHTNGGGGRGTESYIYNGGATDGSVELQDQIHDALIADIRAGWDSTWVDRGKRQADFGELRPLASMPGTLVEIGFHDQAEDAEALLDPRFAQLTARAVYKGIVRYFSADLPLLPEPPRNLYLRNEGGGQVTVFWQPSLTDTLGLLGDAAASYRVYTSTDGFGWTTQHSIPVTDTTLALTGLTPGQLVFVRVTAINAGGESFPTPIGAARVAGSGLAPVLVVNGYERLDRWMDVEQCDTPEANCPNLRVRPAQMNDQSYVIQHAQAIPLAFDSATRGAFSSAAVSPIAYSIIDWIAGQEQTPASMPNDTPEVSLTLAERAQLTAFLNAGRAVFLSGAEVAYDLVTNLNQTLFVTGTLRAQFARDDADTFVVTPTASGILSGVGAIHFDDGTHGTYRVNYPDVITPTNGAVEALRYEGGTGGTAGVQYANGCQRLVYLGFPFETIYPEATRQAVMARILSFLSGDGCISLPPTIVTLSPASDRFYNYHPPFNGVSGGSTSIDHVDVALQQLTPTRFLSGTAWLPVTTWLSATGGATWAFTPSLALSDGPYALWARAWDAAGQPSSIAIISFTIDTISPTAPVPITPTGGVTLPGVVTLVYSPATDANGVAGYAVQLDGGVYTTTATTFPAVNLAAGQHTWAVRAFDAAGNASDWMTAAFATAPYRTYLPIVLRDYNPVPPPTPVCHELAANGGFETREMWYSLSSVKPTYVVSPVHSGLSGLTIGYTGTGGAQVYSSIQQTITIPITATRTTVSFWRYPVSGDLVGDFQYVAYSRSPTMAFTTKSYRSNEMTWTLSTLDLSAYTGTLFIRFGVYNDGQNGVTAMTLDDVSVQSCSP